MSGGRSHPSPFSPGPTQTSPSPGSFFGSSSLTNSPWLHSAPRVCSTPMEGGADYSVFTFTSLQEHELGTEITSWHFIPNMPSVMLCLVQNRCLMNVRWINKPTLLSFLHWMRRQRTVGEDTAGNSLATIPSEHLLALMLEGGTLTYLTSASSTKLNKNHAPVSKRPCHMKCLKKQTFLQETYQDWEETSHTSTRPITKVLVTSAVYPRTG